MKKENKREEKMTLEKLAVMVAGGFEHMGDRIDGLEGDLKSVKKVVEHLDVRMDGLEFKISSAAASWIHDFDRLHDWMEEIDERVNRLEDKVTK